MSLRAFELFKLFLMQSLSQEEWQRASVYEVATTSALARMDDNLDLSGEYGSFFSQSIEKLKDASLVRIHPPFLKLLLYRKPPFLEISIRKIEPKLSISKLAPFQVTRMSSIGCRVWG